GQRRLRFDIFPDGRNDEAAPILVGPSSPVGATVEHLIDANAEAKIPLCVGPRRVSYIGAQRGARDAQAEHVRDEMGAMIEVVSDRAVLAADLLDGLAEIIFEIEGAGA